MAADEEDRLAAVDKNRNRKRGGHPDASGLSGIDQAVSWTHMANATSGTGTCQCHHTGSSRIITIIQILLQIIGRVEPRGEQWLQTRLSMPTLLKGVKSRCMRTHK